MKNIFDSDSILYFPTIEFQSESWVKSALTIWDKIYRIVPDGYIPKDSDEIKIALSNGFIKDITLSHEDLTQTAKSFIEYSKKLNVLPDGFDNPGLKTRLHESKIDSQLLPFFKSFSSAIDSGGFYNLPDDIANGYMYFLSKVVSDRRKISKLTDHESTYVAMTFMDGENGFDSFVYPQDAPDVFSTLLIENLIPADIRSISMEKIIQLNKDSLTTKELFRNEIVSFTEEFSKIEDESFAVERIKNFKLKLFDHQQTKKERMLSLFKELKSSALFVGLPTSVAALAAAMATVDQGDLTLLGKLGIVSIGGIASLANAGNDLRKNWRSQKSSYYLEVKKILTSDENSRLLIPDFTYAMDQFIND